MKNDQDLQEKFKAIEAGVSASDSLRGRVQTHLDGRKKRRFGRRLSWAGAFAVATAFVWGVLLLAPASSSAVLIRVRAALNDAKYIRVRSYSEQPGQPRRLYGDLIWANGSWRSEAFPGTPLARTYIRANGGQWLYLACSDTSIGEPAMENSGLEVPTALELAKSMADEGDVGTPRDFKIVPHPDEAGRATYAVTGTRPGTQYHLEIVVDKATNLPIRSTMTEPGFTDHIGTEEYSYDGKIDPSSFDPKVKPTTKVLTLTTEVARLKRAWTKSMARVAIGECHMDLREVSVNGKGDVFLVCSYRGNIVDGDLEQELLPKELTDDLGREYELVTSLNPGATFGDTVENQDLRLGGDRVKVAMFTPAVPKASWEPAKSFTVTCTARNPVRTDVSTAMQAITVAAPAAMKTRFPWYSDSMFFGYEELEFEMYASDTRARGLEKSGDFAQAAHWYQDAAVQAPMPGFGRRELTSAKRCQDRLGKIP